MWMINLSILWRYFEDFNLRIFLTFNFFINTIYGLRISKRDVISFSLYFSLVSSSLLHLFYIIDLHPLYVVFEFGFPHNFFGVLISISYFLPLFYIVGFLFELVWFNWKSRLNWSIIKLNLKWKYKNYFEN